MIELGEKFDRGTLMATTRNGVVIRLEEIQTVQAEIKNKRRRGPNQVPDVVIFEECRGIRKPKGFTTPIKVSE